MGKKSQPSAPAPDPRLVDAQIQSMGIEQDTIRQMLDLAKRQQDTADSFVPMQREATQFALDTMRQGVADSAADRAFAVGRRDQLVGVQDRILADAANFDEEGRARELSGEAISGVGRQFNAARAAASRQLARTGVNPNDGRFGSMVAGLARDEALAKAGAGTAASRAARMEGLAMTDRANNALAGYPAMTMQATGAGSSIAGGSVNTLNAGVGGIQQNIGAAGQTFGNASNAAAQLGGNATNMFNAQANYKINSDRSAGTDWGGIGALAAGAAKLYPILAGSSVAYKENIVRLGAHPAGVGWYEWTYRQPYRAKWGHGRHVGVLAEELRQVRPDAVGVDADGHTVVNYALI